ncbi:uncharacterized protein AMSG_09908 [Thecamonas trahens ATCC 50062]|uniref:DH domain-containing protein n=1 Tax=Thecamonas trahens ATCC 50062 TaxID=461836 RepID=A0A0L0DQ43_THETB|nr:hypothetical protein AMSG_09908 [Thecamonas trahens ATCC 50062]KNC54131.1 hypothetical protein AMSG_09908 [Thecamonas trahens ATCC 50062]|eukprot:XP_013753953.1 hypothetical protein AMSG_09908 [Thecamonas trahens ATCC 50062]
MSMAIVDSAPTSAIIDDSFFTVDSAPQRNPVELPLTGEPTKRDRLVYELYTTEITYYNSLALLVHEYIQPLRGLGIITREELSALFGSLELIHDLHGSLVDALEVAITSYSPSATMVGSIFLDIIPLFSEYYLPFCEVFGGARDVCARLRASNEQFASYFLQRVQSHGGRDLFFYLIQPIQRLPRYELLLVEISSKTKSSHKDAHALSTAANAIAEANAKVNALLAAAQDAAGSKRKKASTASQAGSAGLDMYLSEPTRRIIWEAPCSLRTPGRSLWGVLFNDMFVVGEKVSASAARAGALFTAELETSLETTWVEDLHDLDPSTINNDAFEVYTPSRSYFLYAGSSSAKHSWMRTVAKTIEAHMARDKLDALIVSAPGADAADAADAADVADGSLRRATYYYDDGSLYDGTLRYGSRHGRGHIFFPSKDHYVGSFVEDQREGSGVFRWASGAVYDGEWRANQPHGTGVYTFKDISYSGEWRAGMRSGSGTLVYGSITYTGEFRDGLRSGVGTLSSSVSPLRYSGSWLRDQRSGTGSAVFDDGSTYEGEWLAGEPHGSGTLVTCGGTRTYIGEFRNGKPWGNGVLSHSSSRKLAYDGEWVAGAYHGSGTLVNDDGSVYTGSFEHGLQSGSGRLVTPWGYEYDGEWLAGRPHGTGSVLYPDGSTYSGGWISGKRSGKGTWETPWGHKYVGQWASDVREGRGREILPSGRRYDGYWKADVRDGFGVEVGVENDAKYSGNWEGGRRSGEGTKAFLWGTYSGNWSKGVREGAGKSVLAGGFVYEGTFFRNRREGRGTATVPTPDSALGESQSIPVMCHAGRVVAPETFVAVEHDVADLGES